MCGISNDAKQMIRASVELQTIIAIITVRLGYVDCVRNVRVSRLRLAHSNALSTNECTNR